jgi:hypothetical protein
MVTMNQQDFIKSMFESVTQDILSSGQQKQDIARNIDNIIYEKANQIIPNMIEKQNRIVGTILDPETGYSHEAYSASMGQASNSYGTPIMDVEGYLAIDLPLRYPDKFINKPNGAQLIENARKVALQDKDWKEDFYKDRYAAKYQEQKKKQIELMFSDAVNNPMKYAMETGLPLKVVQRMNPLAGALITSKDFVTLQVNDNLIETLGMAMLSYNLVDAYARVAAPNLVTKYWSFSDIDIETNVPEGEIIEGTKNEMEEIKFTIGKNVGAVEASWESQLVVTRGDPLGQITSRIATKLAQQRNIQLATILATYGSTAGADMGAMTGDRNTNDPMDTIQPVLDGIANDVSVTAFPNQVPSVWVSGAKAFNKFINNSFTKGIFQPNGTVILNNQQSAGTPNVPFNSTWRTTSLVSATQLFIADPRCSPSVFGPSQRSEYFDNRNLSRATYYFDAFGTYIANANGVKRLTGVVT